VEDHLFEDEGDVRLFLRKSHGHQLTPKGRLWELAEGILNFRNPDHPMDNVDCEDGAFVLDWVVSDKDFTIALMDNGIEEMGSVLGTVTRYFVSACLLTFWFRPSETEEEHEQVCTRAFADMSAECSVRLRDRPY